MGQKAGLGFWSASESSRKDFRPELSSDSHVLSSEDRG